MQPTKKEINKYKKKVARCLAILHKDHPDVSSSEEPTKHVFIGNQGLTTNADESSLCEFINSVGSGLEALTLVPGKQYSFASFTTADYAEAAFLGIQDREEQMELTSPTSATYMAFVDKVPSDIPYISYKTPPGLILVEDFITADEETQFLQLIDWGETLQSKAEGSILKNRQVRHFGYEFKYSSSSVDKENPLDQGIPTALTPVLERIVHCGYMPVLPDQLTVNRYLPGQGIPPHIDTHSSFTGELLSLSTGSGVIMDFRLEGEPSKESENYPPHCAVYLPPRSLCVMTGPSRYEWTHGICPRMTDVVPTNDGGQALQLHHRQERLSLTFRKIREGECSCHNHSVCDSYIRKQKSELEMARNEAPSCNTSSHCDAARLEKEHVLAVYEQIADHFSDTRHKPWPQVLEFVSSLPLGSSLLDVGCGNGKYLGHNKGVLQVGCDTSFELSKICCNRGLEVLTCNCLQLPFKDSAFDAVICIAVIHHLATESRRLGALMELARITSSGWPRLGLCMGHGAAARKKEICLSQAK